MPWPWRRGSKLGLRGETILGKFVDEVQSLGKYDIGETIENVVSKSGRKPSEILKLNANENFFVPLGFLRDLLKEVVEEADPRIYPGKETTDLREALGKYLKVSPEEIMIGTGSDQLIDLISCAILRPGDEALSFRPTFSIYERCVRIQGATYSAIPLAEDFSLNTEKLLASVKPKTKLLFLCSPNNPTANQFDLETIRRVAENFGGLVILDEAYGDFSGESAVSLLEKVRNLLIIRTFSKAFGVAGLRLGYAVADQDLSTVIAEKFQLPYSVSAIALRLALKLLGKIEVINGAIKELKVERNRLIRRLNRISGIHAFDSETNFVLFKVERSSDYVHQALLEKGVIVKNLGRVLDLENCMRVTVAPPPLSETFLNELSEVMR